MKKLLSWLAVLMLLTSAAMADAVGFTADGQYILHHVTDEGEQDIWYVSSLSEIECEKEDYNGDDVTDLAVITRMDGRNVGYELFILTGVGFVQCRHDGGEAALWNFNWENGEVQTEYRGEGPLCTRSRYRFEGADLLLQRRLTCDYVRRTVTDDTTLTQTTDLTQVTVTVTGTGDQVLYTRTAAAEEAEAVLTEAERVLNE